MSLNDQVATDTCPNNSFSKRHVPRALGSAICGKCGGVILAEKQKIDGMATAISKANESYESWLEAFTGYLRVLAASGGEFTSEDITDRVGFYRKPGTNQNNAIGALMSGAAKSGLIVHVRYEPSRLARQHGAVISVWVGK